MGRVKHRLTIDYQFVSIAAGGKLEGYTERSICVAFHPSCRCIESVEVSDEINLVGIRQKISKDQTIVHHLNPFPKLVQRKFMD